ncbi:hypothetical protein GCM10010170_086330 [Dactylosporangium salmoneum]|uniref:Uncharacterized protein n=1 Tax=Dactylosporangium salmoneum TaxID=53361 RepID=A0ABP5UHW7_9ACTN
MGNHQGSRRWRRLERPGTRIAAAVAWLAVGLVIVVGSLPVRRWLGVPDWIGGPFTFTALVAAVIGSLIIVRPLFPAPSDE